MLPFAITVLVLFGFFEESPITMQSAESKNQARLIYMKSN